MECKCVSCGLDFEGDLTGLKEHYRGDLHRYNLKRRAAGMPPIDAAMFQRLRGAAAAALEAESAAAAAEPKVFECKLSNKRFKTRAQFEQYQRSKKYKVLAAKAASRAAEEAERPAAAAASASKAAPTPAAGAAAASAGALDAASDADAAEERTEPDFDSMTEDSHCMFDAFPVDDLEA